VLLAVVAVACSRGPEPCEDVAKRDDHAATIARCTAEYERERDVRAGVAAALAQSRQHDETGLLAWAERLGDVPAAAPVWREVAIVRARRKERARMLEARDKALAGWLALGKLGEAAYEAHEIMRAHWVASELAPSLAAARLGRRLALASDDREMHRISLGDLFILMIGIGDTAAASELLAEATKTVSPDDREMRFYLSFYEGQLQFRAGRLAAARAAYGRVLDLAAAVDDPASLRSAHYNLVEIELALGDIESARTHLSRALSLIPADAPPHARSAAAYYTALVDLAEQAPARARATLAAALAASPIDDWAWQLEHLMGRAREALGELDEAAAAYARAISVVERMRREIQNDPLQLALRDRRRAPYEAAFDLAARMGRTADALAIAEQMWTRRFAEELAAGAERVATPDPVAARVAGLHAIAPAVLAAPLLARPPGEDQAPRDVLAFIESRDTWWRYYRTPRASGLERVPLPAPEVASLAADLRAQPDDRVIATRLGAALIPPSMLDGSSRPLHIVADGALGGAPLAAVIAGGRRLVEARVLAVVPSLGALAPATPPEISGEPVVLGPPRRVELAAARAEAEDVARTLGVPPRSGEEATTKALRLAASAPLLHVATHGGIDPRGAFIELADQRVEASDVLAWQLAPRVVVLASCASGARPGRTLWGAMGAAFLANGSAAVVASLWSVPDQPTRRLITEFYAAGGATTPHLALAHAQRRAIAERRPASEWAAFVVLGAP